MWDTGLGQLLRPISKRAIHAHGDRVIKEKNVEIIMSGHRIKMHLNNILGEEIHNILFPEAKDAEYMVNVEVGVPKGKETVWFVEIYYKFKDGKWKKG